MLLCFEMANKSFREIRDSASHDSTRARNAAMPLAQAVSSNARLALAVLDERSDAMLKQGAGLIPLRPSEEATADTTARTRGVIDALVDAKVNSMRPTRGVIPGQQQVAQGEGGEVARAPGQPQYVRYTPAVRGPKGQTVAPLTVQIFEKPQDPLEPPKFKTHKVARGPAMEDPVPILHSPPRKLSAEDQKAWAIPPCVSNWKNNRGYTIPLDKRLAADGRGLQDLSINDGFAKLSEALYIAEQNARTELERRAELQREYARKEKEKKEQDLMEIAQQAREERAAAAAEAASSAAGMAGVTVKNEIEPGSVEEEELAEQRRDREERERIIGERRMAREREHRLEAYRGTRSKGARDEGRDFAEAVALGTAKPRGSGSGAEVLYDQRLFNQTEGVTSGFGAEDEYNVYTKPLFTDGRSSSLYRPHVDSEIYGNDANSASAAAADKEMERLTRNERFRPERDFSGVDRSAKPSGPRTKPVQFEKSAEADPFGLEALLSDTRGGNAAEKHSLDKIGRGTMLAASASFGSRETYDASGSGRTKLAFQTSTDSVSSTAVDTKYAPGITKRASSSAEASSTSEEPAAKRARSDADDHHRHHHSSSSHSSHHSHHESHDSKH